MIATDNLKAPFPYFGGKRRAVDLVWPCFGTVDNYVEPFCGSIAMLLGAPNEKRVETINDVNGFVVNFWRAIQSEPESVARWADWPVSEVDLEARHAWLVNRGERLRWALHDPDYYDAKVAGWWVWGACSWIGSGWCLGKGPWVSNGVELSDRRQLPHVGDAGMGEFILEWFSSLSARLRDVRITCGDWSRVITPIVTTRHGKTAVFLDPPYDADITKGLYAQEGSVSTEVRKWCLENGSNPDLRIILCGYANEHDMPGWSIIDGKATNGGYGNSAGNQNHKRETLWLSPHCKITKPNENLTLSTT